jgi:glycine C-acetyltransferase
MDGDVASLDKIKALCEKYKAILFVDDAHGTGVLGENGGGTHEYFNLPAGEDIILGTFSKAFAVSGGFISASSPVINYLRLMSRSYMFSASLPPVSIAAVLAGLEVLEKEPDLRQNLHENVLYTTRKLERYGLASTPQAGIIAVNVPESVNIRDLARQFHEAGIFLNAVEYPAVPLSKQRFRISIMASHTRQDIDKLVSVFEEIWTKNIYQKVA